MTVDPLAAGQRLLPESTSPWTDEINNRGLLGWGERTSNSSGSTGTEVGVLRLDDIAIGDERAILVMTSSLRGTGGANDAVTIRLRYTVDGSTPTTSSTEFMVDSCDIDDVGTFEHVGLQRMYSPIGDETLSLLLTVQRSAGTAGTASLGGAATYPIQIMVFDMGPAPSESGVDL